MTLADEKYVSLTTFKKDGTPKPGPVWPVAADDGRVGLITSSESWKVKRLANNDRVELQASDSRGRVKAGTTPVAGSAQVVEGSEFDAIHAKVREKYGFQLTLINGFHSVQRLIGRGGHDSDRAVIVTLDDA
jgi:PPOX class probable F420-dependent enzyme